ncbi:MAG: S41 family peptidase [Peptoniphilaceae bacterium]|nr:S41 family peptidase [Peptoniphilaceae bacterium]MDD7383247.1 S41 family peptidase [Peptoniphilaceae bacterium]MDY3737996.1 S41 family peptidase [Peptoniphilaceae bacterium]
MNEKNKKNIKFIIVIIIVALVSFNTGLFVKSNVSNKSKDKEFLGKYNDLKEIIDQNFLFDYDKKSLNDGAYKGMFQALNDPYTEYYTPEEFNALLEETSGEFAGIGVVVSASDEGMIKVINVMKDSPAEKAKIIPGDYIIKVEGEEFDANSMEDAISKIKGEENTKVKLTILRNENKKNPKEIEKELERKIIEVDTVQKESFDYKGKKIGYLKLTEFDEISPKQFFKNLDELENEEKIDGLIIDLRNNPGGMLSACLEIADRFLDKGIIVTTKDKNGKEIVEKSDGNIDKIPLTILVNENSASASEIFSGALKDRNRAKIIGRTTYGKGIVQQIFPVSEENDGVKITVSEYFTPSGKKIHEKGVKPDYEVESKLNETEVGVENIDKDDQLKKAMEVLFEKIK